LRALRERDKTTSRKLFPHAKKAEGKERMSSEQKKLETLNLKLKNFKLL
jgi:hypothetical protein